MNVMTRRPPATEPPTRGIPSNVAIFGHPIHPMLIPYPVAFLTGVVATDLAAKATRDPFWGRASSVLTGAGIVSGLLAGAVGAVDYFLIRRARDTRMGKTHAYGNPIALGLAAASLAARRGKALPDSGAVSLSLATAAVLGVTAWAGAELSYRYMIGVVGHNDQHDKVEGRHAP